MQIPWVKGKRREVCLPLAQRSQELLARCRRAAPGGEQCPLPKAIARELAKAEKLMAISGIVGDCFN
jgi:hypothetical protein